MSTEKLKLFFEKHQVRYESLSHTPAFTAHETAASMNVQEDNFAKAVMVRIDELVAMAVLPANRKLHIKHLRQATGAKHVQLLHEEDFRELFPDCEPGAMPPFGSLYGIPLFVDRQLKQQPEIVFNAGTHTDAIRISYETYETLVSPAAIPWEN